MVPEKIEQKREITNPDFLLFRENQLKEQKIKEKKKKEIEDQKRKQEEEKTQIIQKLENPQTEIESPENPKKIISYKEFTHFVFETLDFQGKWKVFIGQPSVNFYMVIHGRAGSGKTTFNIQFAIYLSVKFGDVLYISSEEGFSKTLQEKLERQKDLIENLYLADLHSLEDIFDEVPENTYKFIFVDSLNNMKIDAEGMQELREKHPNAATIAIAQSTKDGKMRGSNEIIHDCDIEISVDEGVAKTIKNRYKETGLTYKIF
jgi:predicted ATP-dependent serine protease